MGLYIILILAILILLLSIFTYIIIVKRRNEVFDKLIEDNEETQEAYDKLDKSSFQRSLSKGKEKLHYTWENICNMLESIKKKKEEYKGYQYITGIPRGGLAPATVLSHMLKLRYKDFSEEPFLHGKTIIVDDVIDTGETIQDLIKKYPDIQKDCMFITLIRKNDSPEFDNCESISSTDKWVVFPWEYD